MVLQLKCLSFYLKQHIVRRQGGRILQDILRTHCYLPLFRWKL